MKTKVELEIDIPEDNWIDYCTKYNDLFMRNYCGYWMRGIEHDNNRWLVWEDDEQTSSGEEPDLDLALKAFKQISVREDLLGILPKGYYLLDKETAIKAYIEGVKRWGINWLDGSDANSYDVVIQLALLGEIKYG